MVPVWKFKNGNTICLKPHNLSFMAKTFQLWVVKLGSLIDDEVWSETQHASITLLVGSPAQAEGHEEEPGALQQRHLVIQVQVSEALM